MSRCFEQYSESEKVDILQLKDCSNKSRINRLMAEKDSLEDLIYIMKEAIDKLPKTERGLTYKRIKRMIKETNKNSN